MTKQILLATGNPNKIKEIRSAISSANLKIELVSPKDLNLSHIDPIENSDSLEGNAEIKANEFFKASNLASLADDTGLEVDALGGKPGVKSARFAGENANSEDNRKLLLEMMKSEKNRKARFRTVFCLIDNDQKHFFEGVCEGEITEKEKGNGGFGYDPIFIPNGYDYTFAEMNSELKNEISHRGLAVKSFVNWLKNQY